MHINISIKGGPGSGNWGHRGIPGKVGGSSPRGAGTFSVGSPAYGNLNNVDSKANALLLTATKGAYDERALHRLLADEKANLAWREREGQSALHIEGARRGVARFQAMVDNNTHWIQVTTERRGKIKDDLVSNLSGSTGTSQENVNEIIGEWAETSNDMSRQAISMQEAVSEEFGVPLSDWQESNRIRSKGFVPRDDERKLLRDMYTTTQAELKTAGYKPGDTVTLYRGYEGAKGSSIPDRGTDVNYAGNAMESWSILPSIAGSFGSNPIRGRVLSMNVPVENVLSIATTGFGCLPEGEFVILGSGKGNVAHIMSLDDLGIRQVRS